MTVKLTNSKLQQVKDAALAAGFSFNDVDAGVERYKRKHRYWTRATNWSRTLG